MKNYHVIGGESREICLQGGILHCAVHLYMCVMCCVAIKHVIFLSSLAVTANG